MKLNKYYDDLKDSYLFHTVAVKTAEYAAKHPDKKIIKLGIGDVTRPLPATCVEAMKAACDEQLTVAGFKGYGPYEGFDFLREAISSYYAERGTSVAAREIFVSDGAKSDIGNILDLFDRDNTVLVPDPVYPVYVDTNIMCGRKVVYANAGEENGFLPMPDENVSADLIYICSPNNPTGAAYSREALKEWVRYAKEKNAVILYDAAYEAFVTDPALARSIYEVDGARECAIEFCSFSKNAGFTGVRCGWCVLPDELAVGGKKLAAMWLRRQSTRYNGTPYIIQRGAEAALTGTGQAQIKENLDYYKYNADIIGKGLDSLGIYYTGGVNSPYIWMKCPDGMGSWEFFDLLLDECQVVGTPGEGFGECGKGFFRLTSFGTHESTAEATERIKAKFGK
ncbi:MAG: LL-diaminopimelate aminotransferase [Clostridia bacterium]|nr:LL-diaminopimelate aminotransferase [Clostridia bacterium]